MISKLEVAAIVLEQHQRGQSKWHVYGGVVSYEFFQKSILSASSFRNNLI